MSIVCVICAINVYLSYLFPRVYNNSNLCVLCVTLQKWRLKNKHAYIHVDKQPMFKNYFFNITLLTV